ncbi:hypothetical protein HAX54_047758, partial [Datura stramonium]|nr:hypothetical protein [Datura stramonium]
DSISPLRPQSDRTQHGPRDLNMIEPTMALKPHSGPFGHYTALTPAKRRCQADDTRRFGEPDLRATDLYLQTADANADSIKGSLVKPERKFESCRRAPALAISSKNAHVI